MLNEDKLDSLIISDGNVYRIDIFDKNTTCKPKLKSIDFDVEIITSVDYQGNTVVIYEKKKRQFKFYTNDLTFKSSFDGKFDLNCLKLYQDRWICAGDNWGKIHIFDADKNLYVKSFSTLSNESIVEIVISSDHKQIFTCYENGQVASVNSNSGKSRLFSWIDESISCCTVNPWKTGHILMGSFDGMVGLYDTTVEKRINRFHVHNKRVNCVSYSYYNECLMLSGSDSNQVVLSSTSEKSIRIHKTNSPVTSCSMSDGVLYGFGEANGNVSIFDIRNSRESIYTQKNCNTIDYVQFCFEPFQNKPQDLFDCFNSSENSFNKENLNDSLASCFSNNGNSKSSSNVNRSQDLLNSSNSSSFYDFNSSVSDPPMKSLQTPINSIRSFAYLETPQNKPTEPNKSTNLSLKEVIQNEIHQALKSMESRLQSGIMGQLIEQLAISERNVIDNLMQVRQFNEELRRENDILKEKCKKLPYM